MTIEFERPTAGPLERRPVTKDSGSMAVVIAIAATIAVAALVFFTFADTNRGPSPVSTQPTVTAPERTVPKTTTPPANSTSPAPSTK